MINLDLSKLDSNLKKDAKSLAKKVSEIAIGMDSHSLPGSDFLGWKDLPTYYSKDEVKSIIREAKRLVDENIELLVVIGIGGSFAGAKAAIEMIQGLYPMKRKMEVMFAGESLSSTDLAQKLSYAQNKNFAINVISKSGTTTEPAIAFRAFRKLLEEKVGIATASRYVISTTDANKGALLKLSYQKGYKAFVIPDDVGGRFSVLTAVGLFPMACVGIDINKVLHGALEANSYYSKHTLKDNDAYMYATLRYLLSKKYPVELMVQYEPQMKAFSEWWKQLAGESEGKNEKGLFPASVVFSTDLHSLGQFIQDGSKVLFETVLFVKKPTIDLKITHNSSNADNLNYLADNTVHNVNKVAFSATVEAHSNHGNVPNILLTVPDMTEKTFGQLVIFFERAVAMTAYLLEVNPFNQPGVEVYKKEMFKQLGRP